MYVDKDKAMQEKNLVVSFDLPHEDTEVKNDWRMRIKRSTS